MGRETDPSHPARGAWIEIARVGKMVEIVESHPARGAWIEMFAVPCIVNAIYASHPARGAWIEILAGHVAHLEDTVAPRTGCVD